MQGTDVKIRQLEFSGWNQTYTFAPKGTPKGRQRDAKEVNASS